MHRQQELTVGQVARLAGVTVRTLHHYDELGLVRPGGRTAAGYRCYSAADVERLQHVLFYRELGLPLPVIATVLDEDGTDPATHLRRQRHQLLERIRRLEQMVAAVDRALEADHMGISLTPEERLEVFGDFRPEDHAEEAEQRWGDTQAWAQSQRRTASYRKQDWLAIKAQGDTIERDLATALGEGVDPTSDRATAVAERHRQHISRWFYDCPHEMHVGLGELYVEDERFRAHYEQIAPGLAVFTRDAIRANADRPTA